MSLQTSCQEANEKWLLDSGVRKPGKDGQMRTFDVDGFRRRAGCIIFRNAEENEVRQSTLLDETSKHSLSVDLLLHVYVTH